MIVINRVVSAKVVRHRRGEEKKKKDKKSTVNKVTALNPKVD